MSGVGTKISITDGMSAPLKSMYSGITELVQGLSAVKDAGKNAFDSSAIDAANRHMLTAMAQFKAYEDELKKVKKATEDWQSLGLITQFDTSGITRAEQELNAANMAYERILQEQNQLTTNALNMQLLPPNAAGDINAVKARLANLKKSFATMEKQQSRIGKFDTAGLNRFSTNTENIRRKMAQIELLQKRINSAVKNNDISGVNDGYKELERLVREVSSDIDNNTVAQDKFNNSLGAGASKTKSMANSLKYYASIVATAIGGSKLIDEADDYTNTYARLGLLTDNEIQQRVLRDNIYQSSIDSRSNFKDSMSNIAKLGLLAGDAFDSNSEITYFENLMNKTFKVSGSSNEERTAGMYQLTQAMASGKLQGDEFRSIMENAPMLAQAIADYTGKSKGELKEMSSKGTITADVIKGALFSAADDINEKFEQMPKTFGDIGNELAGQLTMNFSPMFEKINSDLNSVQGTQLITNIGTAISWVVDKVEEVYEWLKKIYVENEPGLHNLASAIAFVGNSFLSAGGYGEKIFGNIVKTITSSGFINSFKVVSTQVGAIATGFTSVLRAATPVLPLITSIYIGFKSYKATNGVLSSIGTAISTVTTNLAAMSGALQGATVKQQLFNVACNANVYLAIASAILSAATALWSFVQAQKAATQASYDASQVSALSDAETSAEVYDYAKSHNVDYSTARSIIQSNKQYDEQMLALIEARTKYYDENVRPYAPGKKELSAELITDMGRTFDNSHPDQNGKWSKLAQEWNTKLAEYDEKFEKIKTEKNVTMNSYIKQYKEMQDLMNKDYGEDTPEGSDGDDDVQKVEVVNTVDIASEDLRYMRDLAEQETINQFTSKFVQPVVSVQFGEVKETADVDAIVAKLTDGFISELDTAGEFVHY